MDWKQYVSVAALVVSVVSFRELRPAGLWVAKVVSHKELLVTLASTDTLTTS